MGDWSMLEGQLVDTVGENLATSRGTTVTAKNLANEKGGWAQIIAATTCAADGLLVTISPTGATGYLVDIAIGAQDSEQIIIANLLSDNFTPRILLPFFFPIGLPAGTRIAARTQCTSANGTVTVTIGLLCQGFLPSANLGRVTTYGAATADSGGVSVDPGANLNTKGAYSQINGATTAPIRALLVGIGGQGNIARTTCFWLLDIAIGAGGSEQIIVPDLQLGCNATGDQVSPGVFGPFFIDIPAGTRLAARAQCDINDADDRLFDIVLYGID